MDASTKYHGLLKAVAAGVVALMGAAIAWGGYVSLAHWSGIGV
ncbi:hypothetical protein [Azohydromonas aeria]|nr:hypothetical protein [Azohydromonas aeria]